MERPNILVCLLSPAGSTMYSLIPSTRFNKQFDFMARIHRRDAAHEAKQPIPSTAIEVIQESMDKLRKLKDEQSVVS